MKPGYQTTEFYMTLGNIIAGVLLMFGFSFNGSQQELGTVLGEGIGAIVALAGLVMYLISRTDLKKKQIEVNKTQG